MPHAAEAHRLATALSGDAVTGWLLDQNQRTALLARIAPIYPSVVAHHVTLTARTAPDAALPEEMAGEIVGMTDDGRGVQALVVRIGCTTDRPDGSTYHITWSLDRAAGREPIESNDVIRQFGWSPLEPIMIRLVPAIVS